MRGDGDPERLLRAPSGRIQVRRVGARRASVRGVRLRHLAGVEAPGGDADDFPGRRFGRVGNRNGRRVTGLPDAIAAVVDGLIAATSGRDREAGRGRCQRGERRARGPRECAGPVLRDRDDDEVADVRRPHERGHVHVRLRSVAAGVGAAEAEQMRKSTTCWSNGDAAIGLFLVWIAECPTARIFATRIQRSIRRSESYTLNVVPAVVLKA